MTHRNSGDFNAQEKRENFIVLILTKSRYTAGITTVLCRVSKPEKGVYCWECYLMMSSVLNKTKEISLN